MPENSQGELTKDEKKLIRELGGDLGAGRTPYADLAARIGLTEDQVIGLIRGLGERGLLRRFGATLRHQKSGFTANAMVAWRVPDERLDEVGNLLASFREVTHCYHRHPAPGWNNNLYTMIHAENQEACHRLAARMAEEAAVDEYELLFSDEEFKKTSMRYFA